jgi:hypothetical protein
MLAPYKLGDLGVFRVLRSIEVRGVLSTRSCLSPKCFKHWVHLSILRIDKHLRYPNRGILTEVIWQVWTELNYMSQTGSSRDVLSEVIGLGRTGSSLWVEILN